MLQIRLSKPTSESGGGVKASSETVTVACPDHLVLADLLVAKSIGSANASAAVKIVGRRSRRQLGERVHFCVRCDFPIAIYGRLSPCDHVFCLDCSRSDSLCYLCDERIQKIQTIKPSEGILICAAPHCLKSFLKRNEFESHIRRTHADLLHPNAEKDGDDSEAANARKPATSDSTVQAPPRPLFSPGSNSQAQDYRLQSGDQQPPRPVMSSKPPFMGFPQNNSSEQQVDSNAAPGFDGFGPRNHYPQHTFDSQNSLQQPGQQQRIPLEPPFMEYPMHPQQHPNFAVPINPNPVLVPPHFGYPPFSSDGVPPFYGIQYGSARPDTKSETRSEQGFPPASAGGMNFLEHYPQQWNMGRPATPTGSGMVDGSTSGSDLQGRSAFVPGEYGRNPGVMSNLPPPPNQGMDRTQGGNYGDPRDGGRSQQTISLPPPPPMPSSNPSQNRSGYYSGDNSHE
ncbi:hypothetical protein Leryth_000063 [Lithospermum erythrorhizon]|nr:hypothetical protein Leryth_000063 [Lithospermum erythrorhizon]